MTRILRTAGRAALLSTLAIAAMASPARAESSFTPAQRQEIISIVRDALKKDPSILADAITSLRAQGEAEKQADTLRVVRENHARLGGSATDVVLGNPAGKVSIVEFYDPRCPYCRKVLPAIDTIVASEKDVRLVEKVIPVLGPNSQIESEALIAAIAQGGYMKLQHALMTNSEPPSAARIRKMALSVGLDADRLERDMKSPDVAATLRDNLDLARKVNVEGTPTFIIGEKIVIPGAVSENDLKTAIASARRDG